MAQAALKHDYEEPAQGATPGVANHSDGRQIDLACRSLTVALDMLLGNYLIHLQGQVSGREIRFHNGRTVTCV